MKGLIAQNLAGMFFQRESMAPKIQSCHMKTIIAVLLVGLWYPLKAETNIAYKTLTMDIEDHGGGGYAIHSPACEIYAVEPEAVNPRGTWSAATEGYAITLRFRTNTFVAGQPILAYLYLRNVTTNIALNYDLHINQGKHSLTAQFNVLDQKTNQVPTRPLVNIMHRWGRGIVNPYEQQRFLVRIDKVFQMEQGKYTIRAKVTVPKIKGDGDAVIESEWNELSVSAP